MARSLQLAAVGLALAQLAAVAPAPLKGFVYTSYTSGGYSNNASDASLAEVAQIGVEVIEIMATWYVDNVVNATQIYQHPSKSPTTADILHAIATAKSKGLKIAFKPQVDSMDGVWRANIGTKFTTEQQWTDLFSNYTAYLSYWCGLAATAGGVDYFNVGTELDGTHHREAQWRTLIANVRSQLPAGTPMWLGPNWSWNGTYGWNLVNFWDQLDYVGIDMYHPLSDHNDPTLAEATAGWADIIGNASAFWKSAQGGNGTKGIIFAEIGYASWVGAATNPPSCCSGPPDPTTQAILYQSFFDAVWGQPWMAGVFWWAWPENQPAGTPCGLGFDIWTKPAANVIATYYGGKNNSFHAAVIDNAGLSAEDKARFIAGRPPYSSAGPSSPRYHASSASPSSSASPIAVYANGITTWEDWSYGATAVFNYSVNPYPAHQYSLMGTITSGYGAVTLTYPGPGTTLNLTSCSSTGSASDAACYTNLEFDLVIANQTQSVELSAWLCACDDCSNCAGPQLPDVSLIYYGPELSTCTLPTAWPASDPAAAHFVIPLTDLYPAPAAASTSSAAAPYAMTIARLQIGITWDQEGVPMAFQVDNLQFT